jgi:phosphoribosylformylglycinamidine synthase
MPGAGQERYFEALRGKCPAQRGSHFSATRDIIKRSFSERLLMSVRVLLLRTAGTNCDRELDHAFRLVGADVDCRHVNTLLADAGRMNDYQILAIPGGFSYGDDIASGKILANQLIHHLQAPLRQFMDDGKLILGVCNGFQVLVKAGLLPGPMAQISGDDWRLATLTYNTCGRFEDRWTRCRADSKLCKWLPEGSAGRVLALPVAHGEGRFVTRDPAVLKALQENDQIVFRYVTAAGENAAAFPDNPNGSTDAIAGICDATGRVLGLMPHPERVADPLTAPAWTRGLAEPDGRVIFEAATSFVRSQHTVTLAT